MYHWKFEQWLLLICLYLHLVPLSSSSYFFFFSCWPFVQRLVCVCLVFFLYAKHKTVLVYVCLCVCVEVPNTLHTLQRWALCTFLPRSLFFFTHLAKCCLNSTCILLRRAAAVIVVCSSANTCLCAFCPPHTIASTVLCIFSSSSSFSSDLDDRFYGKWW